MFTYKCFNITRWLIFFRDAVTNLSPHNVSWIGRGILQGHNKISRSSASFMIDMSQLKFKDHWFLRLLKYSISGKVICIHTSLAFYNSQKGLNQSRCSTGFYFKNKIVEGSHEMQKRCYNNFTNICHITEWIWCLSFLGSPWSQVWTF